MQFKNRLAFGVLFRFKYASQLFLQLGQASKLFEPHCHFADLRLLHTEQIDGIVKLNIAVATSWACRAFKNAGYPELPAVD